MAIVLVVVDGFSIVPNVVELVCDMQIKRIDTMFVVRNALMIWRMNLSGDGKERIRNKKGNDLGYKIGTCKNTSHQ